jgi:glycosyltransferase involved in cell wall biosynthesis
MASVEPRLLAVIPLLPPSPGGGGIYMQLLVNGLLERQFVGYAAVLTEQCPGMPNVELLRDGNLKILRRFPFRAGVSGRSYLRYFQYLWQNLYFLTIPWTVYRLKISHLLVHSSFHNHPNLMWLTVRIMRTILPSVRLIADVRDPKLPESHFSEIYSYHSVICCSENVFQHMAKDHLLIDKLVMIPIVIDVRKPTAQEVLDCKKRYGLESVPYFFNGSGISKEKGIDKALDVVKLIKDIKKDLCLVVAGKKRDWSKDHTEATRLGVLRFVGTIPHRDVILLSAGSEADVNFSSVDSMPRATLEALAAGAQVLLPKGIPEFDRECSDYVVASVMPVEIAKQLQGILSRKQLPNYKMMSHSPDNVLALYNELFNHDVGR